jgi:hypothetical protein
MGVQDGKAAGHGVDALLPGSAPSMLRLAASAAATDGNNKVMVRLSYLLGVGGTTSAARGSPA